MSAHAHAEQHARKGPKSGPSRQQTRQANYGQKLRGRFAKISAEAKRGIIERDIFSLQQSTRADVPGLSEQQADWNPDELTPGRFRYDDPAQNHREFMTWLRRQHRRGVLSVISTDENVYVKRAAQDGTKWANARLREAGYVVNEGQVGVGATFNQSLDAKQLRLLYERNYELLEGITSDTSSNISRALSRGLGQGKNPTEIGREIAGFLGDAKGRATTFARHEVMYAHAKASLDRYETFGVEQLKVLTSAPCEQCEALASGGPYTPGEATGSLPQHPNCVCAWAPVV